MNDAQRLLDSPLTAGAEHLDEPAVVVDATRRWTWRQIHEASLVLSHRLAGASAVCNLCNSRLAFLVTWLAALRSRCLVILPPSGGTADIATVLKTSERTIVVGDADVCPGPWQDDATYLCWRPDRTLPTAAGDDELAWQPAWDEIAVRLYTSGSTGAPEPQPKTLRHLAVGALVLGARLDEELDGGLAAIERIVCSVPPQHMFGLECSVMLPLMHAIPVLDRRPLLPADVRAAFAESPGAPAGTSPSAGPHPAARPPAGVPHAARQPTGTCAPAGAPAGAWIATPLHLRGLVQSGEAVPACRVVIASTMPLAETVARRSEALVGAPVLEIHGSTETGALAMRRTAREPRWRPLQGVRVESAESKTIASGAHFASPATLLDALDIGPDGAYTLLGRHADVIKIAGRRASLAGLNLLLEDLPGLEDGVFYLPATGSETERLCLIHCGPPLDRIATQRWLRARLDPVFLPRAFIRIDRLPRTDNGKLRRQALDRVFAQWLAEGQALPPPRGTAPDDRALRL